MRAGRWCASSHGWPVPVFRIGDAAAILESYQQAVRVALADGFVTREEVQQVQALRHQLGITQADHERVMSELMEEEPDGRSNPAVQVLRADHPPQRPVPSTPLTHGASSPIEHGTRPPSDHGTPDHC
jgi:hypothetical protein